MADILVLQLDGTVFSGSIAKTINSQKVFEQSAFFKSGVRKPEAAYSSMAGANADGLNSPSTSGCPPTGVETIVRGLRRVFRL